MVVTSLFKQAAKALAHHMFETNNPNLIKGIPKKCAIYAEKYYLDIIRLHYEIYLEDYTDYALEHGDVRWCEPMQFEDYLQSTKAGEMPTFSPLDMKEYTYDD